MDEEAIDWSVVETLLNVIHLASGAGPKFTFIAAKANDELMAYLAPPAPEVAADPEPEPEHVDE